MRKTDLGLLEVEQEKAREEYKKYLKACKENSYPHFQKMKKIYNQLKKGYQIMDVLVAMKRAGLNEKGEPILAMARADMKKVTFRGDYQFGRGFYNRINRSTFHPNFRKVFGAEKSLFGENLTNNDLETTVPPIPPEHIPNGKLNNYYILFEVKDWKEITKDPILLKHISGSLYVVLAKWDLTKVERMVLQGG